MPPYPERRFLVVVALLCVGFCLTTGCNKDTIYPESVGRSFREILRAIDALQLTTEYDVLTPVNWQRGDDVFVHPELSETEAMSRFPSGWTELNHYLRLVPDPTS